VEDYKAKPIPALILAVEPTPAASRDRIDPAPSHPGAARLLALVSSREGQERGQIDQGLRRDLTARSFSPVIHRQYRDEG